MDIETVVQDLNKRFAAPLPEFYQRRLIFWYDEEREFEDKLEELALANAKLVRLTGNNQFAVKKLLALDDTGSNYLVYRPFAYASEEDDWLLNIELYSESFRSDLLALWMTELQIDATLAMRKVVKDYRKFFGAKERRARLAAISAKKQLISPAALHLAVMSALSGCDTSPGAVIRALLSAGLETERNTVYADLVSYGADRAFWEMVRQGTGYAEEKPDLTRLMAHILLTAATRTMRPEHLAGLEQFISMPHQSYCYDFISDWLHGNDAMRLYDLAREIEDALRLPQRFDSLQVEDIADTEYFPGINECILKKLMTDIGNRLIDVEAITRMAEKRRSLVWYAPVGDYFDGILQIANMQAFYKTHTAGFHRTKPSQLWKEYTGDYYQMDSFYRLFHTSLANSRRAPNYDLDDLFKRDAEIVEGLYKQWFLGELGNNWTAACADELREYGKILEVEEQTNFYRDHIKNADSRIFVIVSDALRYEVGAELAEQLRRETQAQVKLSGCQAVFPTITKFGMAALLPHRELTAEVRNDKLSVLADGSLTESNYREKLIKAAEPESVALRYDDIIRAKRAERSEWVKGKNVVYIYHDTIDTASHTDDANVFPACEDTIQELKGLVRILVNDFGATNIIITADHGFLYTYEPLTEHDKTDKASFAGQDVEYGRRYAILQNGAEPDYLLPVKFLQGKTDFSAFTPRENVRIKMNGGGLNFVHGGISLQEIAVPVIEYHYLRNSAKEYRQNKGKYDTKPVTVSLLSAGRKISNMIFSLNFYQKDAVGSNREKASYLLYFVDSSGKQISDTQKIIADKTDETTQERTFRCTFNLKSISYSNTETYYLIIADESGLALPQREEFQIDIAFAVEEFNFF